MAAFQHFDVLPLQLQGARNLRAGNRVRLAADLDQQGAQHRKRQRQLQLEAHAPAGLCADANVAAHAPDHVLNHVETDAATGDLRDSLLQREARQEKKLEQLGLGQLFRHRRGGESTRHDRLAHALHGPRRRRRPR